MEKEKCHCEDNEMFENFSCDAEITVSKDNHLELKTWGESLYSVCGICFSLH